MFEYYKSHFHQLIDKEVDFLPFREIFRAHEWLFRLVFHEKSLPGPSLSEERLVEDFETGRYIGGTRCNTSMPDDLYYPGNYYPFLLTGIWLPTLEGKLFSILPDIKQCPLIKERKGREYILFLIHPTAEILYKPLIERHKNDTVYISALSLSSVRSLLVAIPDETGKKFTPALVKVTLNQKTNGILRILKERECALSVANTAILKKILLDIKSSLNGKFPLEIFEDSLGFVPKDYECGLLYRSLPSLFSNNQPFYTIPLLSLYGKKNSDFLKHLVKINTKNNNVTQFLEKALLKPFIKIFVTLLYHYKISIEGHGQNLLLLLDSSNHVIGLFYRDMNGVNLNIEPYKDLLPENLKNPKLSYFESHQHDASYAIESCFVGRGLFPLTKQLVKCAAYFSHTDKKLNRWYKSIADNPCHYLKNWTTENTDSDAHYNPLSTKEFYRYGYVETLFGLCLIHYLKKHHIIKDAIFNSIKDSLLSNEIQFDGSFLAPCSVGPIFLSLVENISTYHS